MYQFVIFSCVLFVSALADTTPLLDQFGGRIVGGEDADIRDAPYQVLIAGKIICGGSIIGNDLVLTAAHCMYGRSKDSFIVRAGSTNMNSGGSIHTIVKSEVHKRYMYYYGSPVNDIALLKVWPPFEFDATRKAVPLFNATDEVKPGSSAVVTGWGVLQFEGAVGSSTLKTVTLPMISKQECFEAYKQNFEGIRPGQICTAPVHGKDSCQGDSGGPLTINGNLAGVVSWGYKCAAGKPGAYTEVAYYRDWIDFYSEQFKKIRYPYWS